jgi:hypothetical protein
MNGKYISSQEIIRNVFRDNGYTIELPWQDAVEWCAESLDLIGAPRSYQPRIACVTISNYRGSLPCDLHEIRQVSGLTTGCVQFPMRESGHTFHPVFSCKEVTTSETSSIDYVAPITTDDDGNPAFNFNSDGSGTVAKANYAGGSSCPADATYTLNDNYIFTNFQDTHKVLVSYWAFPVDKDGFPLCPDNIKFKQALQAYVRMKIDYMLWRKNDIARDVFEYSEREWMWYVGAAGNAGRMPSLDKMESIKNQVMRLIPRMNDHATFFKYSQDIERLKFGK